MTKSARQPSADTPAPAGFPARPRIAAVAIGLFLARYFLPAESAAAGETAAIATAWIALAAVLSYLDWRAGAAWAIDRLDIVVVALTLPIVFAGLGTQVADVDLRVAQNLLLEWFALGVSLLTLRRLAPRDGTRRTLAAALVSLIAALAIYGVWQHYVWYPALGAQFNELERLESLETPTAQERRELRQMQATLGPAAADRDPQTRARLRDRLLNSTEPLGFFALANTFAGILAAGGVFVAWSIPAVAGRQRVIRATVLAVLVVALLLTKSRTAFLAVLAAACVSFALQYGRTWPWRVIAYVSGALSATVALLFAIGGLDLAVLTESSKSLAYRFEYWTATWQLLGEHWLTGVGLGNFRPSYLQFKLPGASEEILDPHNWVLEAWTTAGIIGLVSIMAAITYAGWSALRTPSNQERHPPDSAGNPLYPLLIATALGLVWSGLPITIDPPTACVGIGATLIAACARWTWRDGELERAAFVAAAMFSVHLLASGGFGMPAVTQLWFACLVVWAPQVRPLATINGPRFHVVHGTLFIALIAGLVLVVRPNLERERWLVESAVIVSQGTQPQAAEQALRRAAAADPLSPEPWILMAGFAERRQNVALVREATDNAIARSPSSSTLKQWAAATLKDVGETEAAAAMIADAAKGYPNGSDVQADAAEIFAALDREDAAKFARWALELDEQNQAAGHTDKVFTSARRARLKSIAESS